MKELQHIKRGQNKKSAFIDMRKVLFAKNDGSGKIMKLDGTFLEVDDTDIYDLKKFDTGFLKTPSYLINKKHVLCFTDKTVMMIDGTHIELNESDMARVKNSFAAADTARCRVYRDGSDYSTLTLGDLYAIDLVSDGTSYTVTQEYHAQTEPA